MNHSFYHPYFVINESQCPPGVLRSKKTRLKYLFHIFARAFEVHNGRILDKETTERECHIITNTENNKSSFLPCEAIYHLNLPLVRLYSRQEHFEIHILHVEATFYERLMITACDPMLRAKNIS